jgi:hypothetical protein
LWFFSINKGRYMYINKRIDAKEKERRGKRIQKKGRNIYGIEEAGPSNHFLKIYQFRLALP